MTDSFFKRLNIVPIFNGYDTTNCVYIYPSVYKMMFNRLYGTKTEISYKKHLYVLYYANVLSKIIHSYNNIESSISSKFLEDVLKKIDYLDNNISKTTKNNLISSTGAKLTEMGFLECCSQSYIIPFKNSVKSSKPEYKLSNLSSIIDSKKLVKVYTNCAPDVFWECAIDNKVFKTRHECMSYTAKKCKTINKSPYTSYVNKKYASLIDYMEQYESLDDYYETENKFQKCDLEHYVNIKPNDIVRCLNLPNNSETTIKSLKKIYDIVINKNDKVKLRYKQKSGMRYYEISNFGIQFLPKKVRKELLSSYIEFDVVSSVFSNIILVALEHNINVSYIPAIYRYFCDANSVKFEIWNEIKQAYPHVSKTDVYAYIKHACICYCYGTKPRTELIKNNVENGTFCKTPLTENINIPYECIINIIESNFFINLKKELRYFIKQIRKSASIYNNDMCIQNCNKQYMKIKNKSSGSILAFMIQAKESHVLNKIVNFEMNNKKIIDIPDMIGLLLHDGIYVNKIYAANLTENIPKYLKSAYNLDFFFSCKID